MKYDIHFDSDNSYWHITRDGMPIRILGNIPINEAKRELIRIRKEVGQVKSLYPRYFNKRYEQSTTA